MDLRPEEEDEWSRQGMIGMELKKLAGARLRTRLMVKKCSMSVKFVAPVMGSYEGRF
jgi:hypothetical protein